MEATEVSLECSRWVAQGETHHSPPINSGIGTLAVLRASSWTLLYSSESLGDLCGIMSKYRSIISPEGSAVYQNLISPIPRSPTIWAKCVAFPFASAISVYLNKLRCWASSATVKRAESRSIKSSFEIPLVEPHGQSPDTLSGDVTGPLNAFDKNIAPTKVHVERMIC